MPASLPPFDHTILPTGIRARMVPGINGLSMHVLEAGFEAAPGQATRPCILLLHGFPELAYSWRKVMLPLAAAGYHVIAPDQRGYGRTKGWDGDYDGDLAFFRVLNLVRDALALVAAFGYRQVDVVGHDFGSRVAAWCALTRPDVFRSVVLMSAPFEGAPALPFNTVGGAGQAEPGVELRVEPRVEPKAAAIARTLADLAKLPHPRKHYQWYYSTREANVNMQHAPQGVHDFLRAYYHHKSADWAANQPYPLKAWTAGELAKLPAYYVMDAAQGMAETVAAEMPSREHIVACQWLPDAELAVYSGEYARNGFQGGLQWYRCGTEPAQSAELTLFAGRTIDVPAMFIAGKSDWGTHQNPGAFERMQDTACTQMRDCHLIEGAGHWVQQEQPQAVSRLLLDFLRAQH